MDLHNFLTTVVQKNKVLEHPVIFFTGEGEQPPLIFLRNFLYDIKSSGRHISIIDVQEQPFSQVIAHFETTFLGNSVFFWVKNFQALESKKRKEYIAYFSAYNGINTIAVFSNDEPKKERDNTTVVGIPLVVDGMLCKTLASWLVPKRNEVLIMQLNKMGLHKKKISLDEACLLIQYGAVVGSGFQEFLREWFDKIIMPEGSLFLLSQAFFAKDVPSFLKQWQVLKPLYSDVFWTIYFSEQLWRAFHYIEAMKKNGSDAKVLSVRLPFSFTKKDWRSVSIHELARAHENICGIDHEIKNGGATFSLELFFMQFLNNKFKTHTGIQ